MYVLPLPVATVIKMLRYSAMYLHVTSLAIRALLSFRAEA